MTTRFTIAILLFFLSGCIQLSNQAPLTSISHSPERLIINNATIFTGKVSGRIIQKSLLVENGIIMSISNDPINDPSAHTTEATGKFLMPG